MLSYLTGGPPAIVEWPEHYLMVSGLARTSRGRYGTPL